MFKKLVKTLDFCSSFLNRGILCTIHLYDFTSDLDASLYCLLEELFGENVGYTTVLSEQLAQLSEEATNKAITSSIRILQVLMRNLGHLNLQMLHFVRLLVVER